MAGRNRNRNREGALALQAPRVRIALPQGDGVFKVGGDTYVTEGEAFEIELSATALGPNVEWAHVSGDLPDGVSFADNMDGTAKIHGTPAAAASPVAILVRATKSGSSKKAERAIQLGVAAPAATFGATPLAPAIIGEAYAFDLNDLLDEAGTLPGTWQVTGLPEGFALVGSSIVSDEVPDTESATIDFTYTDALGRVLEGGTTLVIEEAPSFDPVTLFDDLAAHFLGGHGETKSGDDVTAWANRGTDDLSAISDGSPPESLADADGDGAAGIEFINAEKLRLYNAAGDTARTTGHLFTASEKLVVAEIVSNTPGSNGGTIVGDAADWWHFLDKGGSSDLEFANYEGGYDVAAVARDGGNLQLLAYKHVSGEQYVSANGGAWQKKDDSGDTGAVGNACYLGYAYSYNNCDHRLIRLATNDVVPVDIDERLAALAAYRGLS